MNNIPQNLTLRGKNVILRLLAPEDVSDEYVSWLNDAQVNRFLETRFQKNTMESQRAFVDGFDQKTKFLWGIFDQKSGKHIGSITLYDIHPVHKYANYGYLIGDRSFWGTGAIQDAIRLVFDFAFLALDIHSISTGAYAPNVSSIFNYKKMGLSYQGRIPERFWHEDRFVDEVIYGLTKGEWVRYREKLAY